MSCGGVLQFAYRARQKDGAVIKNNVEAASLKDAISALKGRGLIVSDIHPSSSHPMAGWLTRSVSLRDRIIFVQELSLMLKAGIPMTRVLSDIESQTNNRTLANTLKAVSADIHGGVNFSDALAKHPKIFDHLTIAVIRSGEASGKLVDVLERLAKQMEKDAELRGKIKSALIYPIILVGALIIVSIMVILFVIPQLKNIFAESDTALPLITRILLSLTDFLLNYGIIILGVLVILFIAFSILIRRPDYGLIFDRFKIRFPVLGSLSQKTSMARFANTGATLLTAGLPLVQVVNISESVIGNKYFEKELARAGRAIEAGTSLSSALRGGRIFPPMVANILAVGEESGNLDQTFQSVSDFFDKEVESTTRNLATIIEPVLMIVMGVGIGFMVSAVILPIYRLVQTF